MVNEAINNLLTRRSVRNYKPEQIKDEELEMVLKAGSYAPSGRGLQSAMMIAVQNKQEIDKLANIFNQVRKTSGNPFFNAPTVILVLARKEVSTHHDDGCAVMSNLLNAAHAIGLGSCWVHHFKAILETREGQEIIKAYGVDVSEYVGIAHLALGYPLGELKKPAPRKEGNIIIIK
jgi:nitroreductase